jgi:predicted nucleotidyltransferase component of viral defense system
MWLDYLKVVITEAKILVANTLLFDPIKKSRLIDGIETKVLSKKEAYAENLRALFCRQEPAIRDLFDVKHMVANSILSGYDEVLLKLGRQKIAVPGNNFMGMTPDRIRILES